MIASSSNSQRIAHENDVPSTSAEPRRSNRARKAKNYGSDFHLYLVEGSRNEIKRNINIVSILRKILKPIVRP